MADKLMTTRLVTRDECPWLKHDVLAGTVVYRCTLAMYGAIGWTGIGVTSEPDEYPFFELPRDSVRPA